MINKKINTFQAIRLSIIVSAYVFFLWTFVGYWLDTASAQTTPCVNKKNGDADCIADSSGKAVTIVDFQIWRNEFFNACTPVDVGGCGLDEDHDGSPMDANFDYPGSGYTATDVMVTIADFEIWRKGYFTAGPAPTSTNTPTPTSPISCTYPSEILNLTNWKITLPVGSGGSPTEIKPPAIQTYKIDPWFMPNTNCTGVQFRAHTSSSTTTSGSSYPRSELRERTADGSAEIGWTNSSGTHTLTIDQAITSVPKGKRHVVAGQIHDGNDDVTVFRLELPDNSTTNIGTLYVTEGNNTHAKVITNSYTLGTRFQVRFVATTGKIEMYYKPEGTANFTLIHTLNKTISGSYFKAGAYTQSNCTTESQYNSQCAADNYGEVIIYNVTASHTQ